MSLSFYVTCPAREEVGHRAHEPDGGIVTGILKNPWIEGGGGRRRSGYCRFCQNLIFSNFLTGHLTRDIRWGRWYHETYTVTEWP